MKRQARRDGQSPVEFALCLPLLIAILLGVLDLGRVFNAYIVITNAAREGANYGTLHPTDSNGIIQQAISDAQGTGITLRPDNVCISSAGSTGVPMQVAVSYDFSLVSAFLLGGRVLHLRSSAEMLVVV